MITEWAIGRANAPAEFVRRTPFCMMRWKTGASVPADAACSHFRFGAFSNALKNVGLVPEVHTSPVNAAMSICAISSGSSSRS